MTQTKNNMRIDILLSLQRALLGEISPALRGVTVDWNQNEIKIASYFDGPISQEDQESMSCVETEVMADFPEHRVILEALRKDVPSPIPCLRVWVYQRRERVRFPDEREEI